MWLLPASQTRDKDALTDEGVGEIIARAADQVRLDLCDSPAGIERGATLAMRYADEAVIVTNPEVSSVRDSDRIIGMLDPKTVKAEQGERVTKHVLITRYDPARAARGEMLSIDDVLEILADAAARHHSRESGRAARLECRLSGHPEQRGQRTGPRLCRRRPPADGRNRRHDRAGRTQGLDEPVARTEGRMNMNLLRLFNGRKASAPVARERLQILLAHERGLRGQPDLLATLREEILAVVSRHIQLDPEEGHGQAGPGPDRIDAREVDIEVPNGFEQAKVPRRQAIRGRLTPP